MYTPTHQELEEMGFSHPANIKKQYEWYIVNDNYRLLYWIDKGIAELTIGGIKPKRKQYKISSNQDIEKLISLITNQK